MSDEIDDYLADLDGAFAIAKLQAERAANKHNKTLKLTCRECGSDSYVPGLRCLCGHEEPIENAWHIVRGDEFGYAIVPLSAQRKVVATFHVDM